MKSYVSERQWRLAGKGWEIRAFLRQQLKLAGRDASLLYFLQTRKGDAGRINAEAVAVSR